MKEKFLAFFMKNKKLLLIIVAVFLCALLGLVGWLAFGNKDKEPTGAVTEEGYDENISVEDAIEKGYFPAHVLDELSKPANDNILPDNISKKALAERRIRYEMANGDLIKVVVVDDVKLAADDFDTMTVRIRSLTGDDFSRWRLYLKTTSRAELANSEDCRAFDSRGINKEAYSATEPDKDGWITLTIELNQLAMWNEARTIRGFSLGVEHKGSMFELKDIRFTKEGRSSLVGQTAISGSVVEGDFTAELLDDLSYHTWNFVGNDTSSSKELTDTGIRYKTTKNESASIKAVVVRNIEMDADKFNTMTVKLRSISMREFTRWRLYLQTNKGGSVTVNTEFIADTAHTYASAFDISEADKDGWITVTIDVGRMKEWQEADIIKGFALGYVNTGNTIEVESIKFTYVEKPTPVTVTNGNFPASRLYTNCDELWNLDELSISKKELRSTGLKFRIASGKESTSSIKVVRVKGASLRTADYDTLTVKIRSLDGTEFTRWRLYLETNKGTTIADKTQVLDTANLNADLLTVSKPDKNGWITLTYNLGGLGPWTKATKVTAFGVGYVNKGNNIEVASMEFTKEQPDPVTITDGNITAARLYSNSEEDMNYEGTLSKKELRSTGLKYTVAQVRNALKIIKVQKLNMNTADYDTLTVKIRSLDYQKFTRWRLFLVTDKGGALAHGYEVLDTNGTNKELVNISKEDARGWITVTFDLSGLAEWTGAKKLTAFGVGYVNSGINIEVASMKFTKEKPDPVTDGNFTPELLNVFSEEDLNYEGTHSKKELLSTGLKYTVATTRNALKIIKVQPTNMNTADYDTLTVRLRSLDNTEFTRWRLFLVTNKGGALAHDYEVMDSDPAKNNNPSLVSWTKPDADGWVTATFSLNGLSEWTGATKLTAFGVGYVNIGKNIEVESIKFTSRKLNNDIEKELGIGNFPAEVLIQAGRPIKDNNMSDTSSTQALVDDAVLYNFGETLALKSVYINHLNLATSEYGSMVVKLRSETDFERFRLYLTTDMGGSLESSPVVDTAKDLNANLVTIGTPDSGGWFTVTIKVSELDAWKNATTVNGFSFGFVNEGETQEISKIYFTKKGGSFSAQALYSFGTPLYGNSAFTEIQETLNDSSVTYTYVAEQTDELKSVCVENLEIDAAASNRMTLRIRSLEGKEFTNYRLYLLTDLGGALSENEVIDLASAKNAAAMKVSEPDQDGWITVEVTLSDLTEWTGTLQGFNFAWLNEGTTFEVADVEFTYVSDGNFTPALLNVISEEDLNYGGVLSQKELRPTGLKYTVAQVREALKIIKVQQTDLNTADYDTLTVKLRSLDNTAFTRWRLFLVTDKGGALAHDFQVLDTKNTNRDIVNISAPDTDGWITVTFDLSGLSQWTDATKLTAFGVGYVNKGKNIEVASMKFTKEAVADGNFTPEILNILSREIWNLEVEYISTKELRSTGLKYTIAPGKENTGSLKVIRVRPTDMNTADYDTLTVKLRSLDNKSFERWRLFLVTDKGGAVAHGSEVLDTNKTNKHLANISAPDADGWVTATFDLSGLSQWTGATKLTAFGVGYVNKGNNIEVASIQFTKK